MAPFWFSGARVKEVSPVVKGKSWELVTAPLPSALPPQENRMTVSPAALLGSKFRHPCVRLETTSVEFGALFYEGQYCADILKDRSTYVNTGSDEVKLLSSTPSTCLQLNRDQILSEVTGGGVNKETLTRRIFDGDG